MNTQKQKLAEFLLAEIKANGNSAPQLERQMAKKGIFIFNQKFLRWKDCNNNTFPDFEDLNRLAQWKGLTLPDFLIIYLGYDVKTLIDDAVLSQLSTADLAVLASKANAVLLNRLEKNVQEPQKLNISNSALITNDLVVQLGKALNEVIKAYSIRYEDVAKDLHLPIPLINFLCLNPDGCKISEEVCEKILAYVNSFASNNNVSQALQNIKALSVLAS